MTEDHSNRRDNVKYIISVDNADPNVWAYCLARVTGESINSKVEVILAKSETDEHKNDFYTEVVNLIKYFNANLIYDNKNKNLNHAFKELPE